MKTMKTGIFALSIAAAGLFAFKSIETGSIKGTVTPADGATRAWALSTTDTLREIFRVGVSKLPTQKLVLTE
jgi:hypothetical protein